VEMGISLKFDYLRGDNACDGNYMLRDFNNISVISWRYYKGISENGMTIFTNRKPNFFLLLIFSVIF
jgi:hypothetical protein